jgi:small subunit ribosomal protein S20
MPHTKSAKKNMRKAEKRRIANKVAKKSIKKQLKTFLGAADGPIDELKKLYDLTAKKLDKAAAKKVIHPNLAARKKAQLAKLVNKKAAAPPAPAPTAS